MFKCEHWLKLLICMCMILYSALLPRNWLTGLHEWAGIQLCLLKWPVSVEAYFLSFMPCKKKKKKNPWKGANETSLHLYSYICVAYYKIGLFTQQLYKQTKSLICVSGTGTQAPPNPLRVNQSLRSTRTFFHQLILSQQLRYPDTLLIDIHLLHISHLVQHVILQELSKTMDCKWEIHLIF